MHCQAREPEAHLRPTAAPSRPRRAALSSWCVGVLLALAGCGTQDKAPAMSTGADGGVLPILAPSTIGPSAIGTCVKESSGPASERFVVSSATDQTAPGAVFTLTTTGTDAKLPVSEIVSRGGQPLMAVHSNGAPDHLELSIDLLDGSNVLRHIDISRAGSVVQASIDGRRLSPFAVGSDPSTATFADGAPGPVFVMDPATIETIRSVSAQAENQMPTCGAAGATPAPNAPEGMGSPAQLSLGGERTEDFEADACKVVCGVTGDSCGCCSTCCEVVFGTCAASATVGLGVCAVGSATAATVACVAAYIVAETSCFSEVDNCTNACALSSSCCGPACGAGSTSQSCAFPHCNSGTVCCNGLSAAGPNPTPSEPGSACCSSASDCCGGTCLEGVFAGGKCLDPNAGTFCFGPAGDICGNGCCEPNTPTCRIHSASQTLCCAANAGDICNDSTLCCPSGSPKCLNQNLCCGTNDIVCSPTSTACCPPPGNCVGGECCNAPSFACNGQCCPSDATCTQDGCCGGATFGDTVCGSHCCANSDSCVAGECCPSAQVCGNSCCGTGQACVNGACEGCGAGMAICTTGGTALCCASGATCSATACCPADMPYCPFDGECSSVCIPPP